MMALPLWLDVLASVLVLAGAGFALVGSFGLVKLGDFYKRLHGPTKAVTLGVGCVLIASMLVLSFSMDRLIVHELLITLFVFLTAPISAHLLVKAALTLDPGGRPGEPPGGTLLPFQGGGREGDGGSS